MATSTTPDQFLIQIAADVRVIKILLLQGDTVNALDRVMTCDKKLEEAVGVVHEKRRAYRSKRNKRFNWF